MKKNMLDNKSIHTKKANIGYSCLDSLGKLKIVSILNFLQDAASEHASLMGVSGFDLARKNLAWVIARYQIEIKTLPNWMDDIKIETWRTPVKNLYELRQFRITNSHALEIINARACWVMVKKENSRPVRLSRYLPDKYLTRGEETRAEDFQDLKSPLSVDYELAFKVRMHDLDLNGHVNNAIYIEWAVETMPEPLMLNHRPGKIKVAFQKESFYGVRILSKTQIIQTHDRLETLHSIMDIQQEMELARINIIWRPINSI